MIITALLGEQLWKFLYMNSMWHYAFTNTCNQYLQCGLNQFKDNVIILSIVDEVKLVLKSIAEFLNLSTTDILDQIIICLGVGLGVGMMFCSIPGLHQLSQHTPCKTDNPKCPHTLQNVPGINLPLFKDNTCLTYNTMSRIQFDYNQIKSCVHIKIRKK